MVKNRHVSKKIDIIRLYLGDYNKSISGREIARLSKMNHQTANIYLSELVKSNVITYQIKGRNKEYKLNLADIKSRIMIEIAENLKAFEMLNEKEINIILPEIIQYADSVILFGSFAYGNYDSKSDIDLIIVGNSNTDEINKIKKRYSREINIEYVSLKEFKNALYSKKHLALEVLKNHIIFGGVSNIISIFWDWYKK